MICVIAGCERDDIAARGWCRKHYQRWRKHGDLTDRGITGKGVRRQYYLDHVNDVSANCILWPFPTTKNGYGQMSYEGQAVYIHQAACGYHHGPRPKGMQVRHLCGTPACFNSEHLRWGTPSENAADTVTHGRTTTGERNRHAKLSQRQVDELRTRYAEGDVTYPELATEFNLAPNHVGKIIRKLVWV